MTKALKTLICLFFILTANLLLAQSKKEHKAFKKTVTQVIENWQTTPNDFNSFEEASTFLPELGVRGKYFLNKKLINLLPIAKVVGEPVFLSGPHKKDMNFNAVDFGHYNPKFLKKLNALLLVLLADKNFKESSGVFYVKELKKYLQTMMHAYEYVIENEEVKIASLDLYKKYFKEDASKASFNMQEYFGEFTKQFEEAGYDWYELSTAAVFWLRRSMDNTDKDFYDLLLLMIKTYDRSFMERQ